MSKEIENVYMFANGMMAVFDKDGQQISELQEALPTMWAEKAKELGYEINGLIVNCPDGRKVKLFEWEFDGEKKINFEVI